MAYVIYYVYLRYLAFAIIAISLPIIGLILLKIIQKLTVGRCRSMVCLNGKTAIVTGGGQGIGFQTALTLASRGCRVIIADKEDCTRAKNHIIDCTNNSNIVTKHLDLTSLQSVRKFAKDINETEERLDILINNAGVGSGGHKYTEDGLHPTMQVNYFGPFLLTHLLTGLLKKSAPSRIIFVSSITAYKSNLSLSNLNYPNNVPPSLIRTSFIYANSKLCTTIAANGFADKLKEYGVTSNSLHPGLVNTDIFIRAGRIVGWEGLAKFMRDTVIFAYGKTPQEGCQTTIHLALSKKVKDVTGKFFLDCRMFLPPPLTWNKKLCDSIWEETEKLVNLKPEEMLT